MIAEPPDGATPEAMFKVAWDQLSSHFEREDIDAIEIRHMTAGNGKEYAGYKVEGRVVALIPIKLMGDFRRYVTERADGWTHWDNRH